jgi:hypothetical protein
MEAECPVPKCFKVTRGCQCPNAWIEFLSSNAREQRLRMATNPRLRNKTIQTHAREYRRAKHMYAPLAGQDNATCRSNTQVVCGMLDVRKGQIRRLGPESSESSSSRTTRALRLPGRDLPTFARWGACPRAFSKPSPKGAISRLAVACASQVKRRRLRQSSRDRRRLRQHRLV